MSKLTVLHTEDTAKYQNGLIFLLLPRNCTTIKVIPNQCGANNKIAKRNSKLKSISIRKANAEEKKVKTLTQVQRSGFRG